MRPLLSLSATLLSLSLIFLLPGTLQAQSVNASFKKTIDSLQKENDYLKELLKISTPVKEAQNDDIMFRVVRVSGSKAAHTITIDFLITDQGADVQTFTTSIRSIIDAGGNEYPISKYVLGAQAGDHMAFLIAKLFKDTPLKCSYTFSGADPGVLLIKRLDMPYRSGRSDNGNAADGKVFFTDLPVTWK